MGPSCNKSGFYGRQIGAFGWCLQKSEIGPAELTEHNAVNSNNKTATILSFMCSS